MTGLMSGHLGQIHGKPWFSFALRFNRNTKIMKERLVLVEINTPASLRKGFN